MTWLDLGVGAAATWRITHLLLYENGPFSLLRKLRVLFGVVYADDSSTEVTSFKYEITTCPWCLSPWVGLVATLLLLWRSGGRWLLLPFTFSAINVWIMHYMTRKQQPDFPPFEVK